MRNCKILEIPHDFCICQQNTSTIENPNEDNRTVKAAHFLVDELNGILNRSVDVDNCRQLTLKSVRRSKIIYYENRQYYKVSFIVAPSQGEFEAIARLVDADANVNSDIRFQLTSTRIDRMNAYGKQGDYSRLHQHQQESCNCFELA